MFRFTAFTTVLTIQKINEPSELLNSDWLKSSEPVSVTEMFLLELKPVLGESSSRHVTL